EPERVLVVTVDPAVKALNNATFGKSYEKTITTRDVQPSVGFAMRIARIPEKSVSQSDRDTLKNLGDRLKMLVFGQDNAIEALTEA
ncbi:hypothetical protein MJN76_29575, partial [Salmonella enterica subsp. enterica serovar Anatum]|nr:hypothetical protein [Salmonella enterica subsp. enterica serovar Anatum]